MEITLNKRYFCDITQRLQMTSQSQKIRSETARVLKELTAALRARYGDRYLELLVYGSEARGEAQPHSDIDLLLILKGEVKPSKEIDLIADILADFNLRHDVLLAVLPITQEKYKTAEGPFWRNVRREAIAA